MRCQKAGKKLYTIVCDTAIGKAAARELHRSPDQDACNMARTAVHLREHIFDLQQKFDGEFAPNAQEKSVPPILSSWYCAALQSSTIQTQKVMIEIKCCGCKKKNLQESVHAARGDLCVQPGANVEEHVMGSNMYS